MEKIQSHFLQDIYRLKEGIILEVNKYKTIRYFSEHSRNNEKAKKKKLKGISKTYQLEEDFEQYDGSIVPKGTYIKSTMIIEAVSQPKDFKIDLKSSGGSIYGDIEFHRKLYHDIEQILSSYE